MLFVVFQGGVRYDRYELRRRVARRETSAWQNMSQYRCLDAKKSSKCLCCVAKSWSSVIRLRLTSLVINDYARSLFEGWVKVLWVIEVWTKIPSVYRL